jgi:hypothetical protein
MLSRGCLPCQEGYRPLVPENQHGRSRPTILIIRNYSNRGTGDPDARRIAVCSSKVLQILKKSTLFFSSRFAIGQRHQHRSEAVVHAAICGRMPRGPTHILSGQAMRTETSSKQDQLPATSRSQRDTRVDRRRARLQFNFERTSRVRRYKSRVSGSTVNRPR